MQLYNADCLEIMKGMESNSVDLVLTDPPYPKLKGDLNVTFTSGVGTRKSESKTVADPWEATLDWLPEAWRVSKYGLLCFCSFHFVADVPRVLGVEPTALVTWYQRNAMPSVCNAPHFQTEFCWAFKKTPGLKWKALKTFYDVPRLQTGCMATERLVDAAGKALHPSQKPVRIIKELLQIGGDSVLDCFMGTGTTGEACVDMERQFIGIERDPQHYETARKRLEQAKSQMRLAL